MWETILAKYGWVVVGVTFGLAAKYALLMKKGVRIRGWLIAADILLLPLVALIAYAFASYCGLEAEMRALASAFCTVGADRLVKLLTERFLQRVDAETRLIAEETVGRIRQEVQTVRSGEAIIGDTLDGRAHDEYAALKPHPQTKNS